jgi:hypothetical protein
MPFVQRSFLVLILLATAACTERGAATPTSAPRGGPPASSLAATVSPSSMPTTPIPTPAPGVQRLGSPTGVAVTWKAPDFQPLAGAKANFGRLGNAVYRIEMPESWNGSLVLWAHGFRGFGTEVSVTSPPQALRETFLKAGYAWAASSYSENGYTPGVGADDTLALKRFFETRYGRPKRTYIGGESMGGNVVALELENYPAEFDGALALCGALGGEEEIDYLVSWSMAAEFASGVSIPIGQGGSGLTLTLLQQIPAALGPPAAPTERGKRFESLIRETTGGPRPFFVEGFKEQYTVNFGFALVDPERATLPVKAATNVGIRYRVAPGLGVSNGEANSGIRRLAADPSARDAVAHPDAVPTTGRISTPLLTLHNTGDLFVPISHEVGYRLNADAAGAGRFLVQRAIRDGGHCRFSDAELTTAWKDLTAWVEEGKVPGGDNLLGELLDIGRTYTNPLRPTDPGTK